MYSLSLSFPILLAWIIAATAFTSLSPISSAAPNGFLADSYAYHDGWSESEWFGLFRDRNGQWIEHNHHGLLYLRESGEGRIQFHQPHEGWFYTSAEIYPWVYHHTLEQWSFYLPNSFRWFYRYGDGWSKLPPFGIQAPAFPFYYWPSGETTLIELEAEYEAPSAMLSLSSPDVLVEDILNIEISGLGNRLPARLYLGDGYHTTIWEDGDIQYAYNRPGDFTVRLIYPGYLGVLEAPVSVIAPTPLSIQGVAIRFDIPEDGATPNSPFRVFWPDQPAPYIALDIEYSGSGHHSANVEVVVLDPYGDPIPMAEMTVVLPPTENGSTGSISITTPERILTGNHAGALPQGDYLVQAFLHLDGIDSDPSPTPFTTTPLGFLSYQTLPDVERDCAELEEMLRMMLAELDAKLGHRDQLWDEYDRLVEEIINLHADKRDAEDARDSAEEDIAAAEEHLEDLLRWAKSAMWDSVVFFTYEDESEIADLSADAIRSEHPDYPAGANVVSDGIPHGGVNGIGFVAVSSRYYHRQRLEAESRGRVTGVQHWLNRLSEAKQNLDEAKDKKEAAEHRIETIEKEIADREARIEEIEAEIDACDQAINAQRDQIQDLLDIAEECREILEALIRLQEENRRAIRQARQNQRQAENAARSAENAANNTRGQIDRRSGSADQKATDQAEVDAAKADAEEAGDKAREAAARLDEASEANRDGDPERAAELIDEARQLIEESRQLSSGANQASSRVRSRVSDRPFKQCEDGDTIIGPWLSKFIAEQIEDFALSPMGSDPETWARSLEGGQQTIDRINQALLIGNVLQGAGGAVRANSYEGAGGAVVDELIGLVFDLPQAIFDAFIEYIQASRPMDLHVRVRGYTEESRTVFTCIDSLWVSSQETRPGDRPVFRSYKLGPVISASEEERQQAMAALLARLARQLSISVEE